MARIDMPEGANVLVPGEYSLIEAALSNKGNPTSQAFNNLMLVEQSQPVRIVDKSGNVIFEGIGPEAARQAVAIGQNLTDTQGKKAGWDIQTVPVGTDSFKTIANEKVDANVLGQIADVALPIAGTLLAGPLGLGALGLGAAGTAAAGAAIGSGISSAAQGRSLEDSLLRAAIAGGSSYLGGQLLAPGAPAPMTGINADLIPNALEGLSFGSLASASVPAAVGGAVGDIIVNAAPSLLGSTVGSTVGSAVGSAVPSLITPPPPAPTQPPLDDTIVVSGATVPSGSGVPFGAALPVPVEAILSGVLPAAQPLPTEQPTVTQPEEIVVTAQQPSELNLGGVLDALTPTIALPLAPTPTPPSPTPMPEEIVVTGAENPVIPTEAVAAVPVVGGILAATGGGAPNVVNGIDQATGDIVVEAAPKPVLPPPPIVGVETALPAITGGALTAAQTAGPQPSTKDGILGTGLTLPQLLSIGGIGADLLKNLLAGGGDTGPQTPYVSPFGTGVGFAPGQDMRANPNITDYERYGFGPEAMFFQPGYGLLNSAAPAPAPQAQPIMATNPRYEPLI